MKKQTIGVFIAGVSLLGIWQGTALALGQSSGGAFAITHSTVVSAAALTGGAFKMRGTIGQAVADTVSASGYAINPGFVMSGDVIFQNGFEP